MDDQQAVLVDVLAEEEEERLRLLRCASCVPLVCLLCVPALASLSLSLARSLSLFFAVGLSALTLPPSVGNLCPRLSLSLSRARSLSLGLLLSRCLSVAVSLSLCLAVSRKMALLTHGGTQGGRPYRVSRRCLRRGSRRCLRRGHTHALGDECTRACRMNTLTHCREEQEEREDEAAVCLQCAARCSSARYLRPFFRLY